MGAQQTHPVGNANNRGTNGFLRMRHNDRVGNTRVRGIAGGQHSAIGEAVECLVVGTGIA